MAYTLGAVTTRPTIRRGSKGNSVKEAQRLLQQKTSAGDLIKVTGVFDDITESATLQFQTANKLKVDGVIGPQTWSALLGKKVQSTAAAAKKKEAAPAPAPAPAAPVAREPSPSSKWPLFVAGAAVLGLFLFMRK